MPKKEPPFRAEHVGSLLRPQALIDVRHAMEGEKGDRAELRKQLQELEDTSIRKIVQTQLALGFNAVTDGEYRRHQFWGDFFPGLQGFERVLNPPMDTFRPYVPDIAAFAASKDNPDETVLCTGKISHAGSTYLPEWNFLNSGVVSLALQDWEGIPEDVYPNDAAYFADIAAAYRTEIDILHQAGVRNIQLDDPNLAYFCSEKMLAGFRAEGEDPSALFDVYIGLYNDCLSGRPPDIHAGVHARRGNFVSSQHFSEGSYDEIAIKLFRDLNVDTYYLEYDTPHAGGFEPLAHLYPDKNVILGLVTSKFPDMEDKEKMKEKVFAAADIIAKGQGGSATRESALKHMGVSPQCGFASHVDGNLLSKDDMVA